MRRTVEEMIEFEMDKSGIVMCRHMDGVFIDNLISSIPRYMFRTLDAYVKVITVARVMGAVDARVVAVPEFVSGEDRLAVLWFMFSRHKEWIIGWHEVIG